MKAPKVSLIAAAALALSMALAPFSRAQDNTENKDNAKPERPPPGQRERRQGPGGANQFERISERLKLTDDQKAKLQPIFREEAAKLRELRQDTALTAEQRREKVRQVREEFLGKMKPILTPEQLEQLKKMREQAPGRGQRGPRAGAGAREGSNSDPKE